MRGISADAVKGYSPTLLDKIDEGIARRRAERVARGRIAERGKRGRSPASKLPRIKVVLSNGRKQWADVVRLNKSTVWCRLVSDGNLIKRTLRRIPEEYVEQLQRWLDENAI